MGEFAVSFELSGQFFNEEGNPAPYIHIAHALEQAFNFTFGDAVKSNFFFSTFKKFSFQPISAVCIQHKVGHFCYSL